MLREPTLRILIELPPGASNADDMKNHCDWHPERRNDAQRQHRQWFRCQSIAEKLQPRRREHAKCNGHHKICDPSSLPENEASLTTRFCQIVHDERSGQPDADISPTSRQCKSLRQNAVSGGDDEREPGHPPGLQRCEHSNIQRKCKFAETWGNPKPD